jgi:nitrite reductase (NADH) small subunit
MDGSKVEAQWHEVCGVEDIWPNTGVCALVEGRQIAVFRLVADGDEQLFALDNRDPWSDANVLSRGLVGNLGERLVVASPIYKHHYDLATGECVEDPATPIRAYPVRVADGRVWVAI